MNAEYMFVVDRWFSSTCAYSIAWKNTNGGPESIDNLDESLFCRPIDLMKPNLTILLEMDHELRKNRVSSRSSSRVILPRIEGKGRTLTKEDYNPWDSRLSNYVNLGKRIMRIHERLVIGSNCTKVKINANANKQPNCPRIYEKIFVSN